MLAPFSEAASAERLRAIEPDQGLTGPALNLSQPHAQSNQSLGPAANRFVL